MATENCWFLGRNRSTNVLYAGSQSVNQTKQIPNKFEGLEKREEGIELFA